jgi:hypothetical protein
MEATTMNHDPAELPTASACDHPADHLLEALCPHCGRVVDACCPDCHRNVEASGAAVGERVSAEASSCLGRVEFYRRLVVMLMNARNTKFLLGCYLISTGDGFADGVSMTAFAEKWGVRKATVSKQCRFICGYLGIPPSRYMREESVARGFALSNRRPRKMETN